MTELRDEAIADLRATIAAGRRCADQIEEALVAYRIVVDKLEEGLAISQAVALGNVADSRRDLTRLSEEFEAARRRSRDSLMRADIVSGSSAKSVSDTWGLSREDDDPPVPEAED